MGKHQNNEEGWRLLSQGEASYLFTDDDPLDEPVDPQQMFTDSWDDTAETEIVDLKSLRL